MTTFALDDPQEPALLGLDNVPLDLEPAGHGTRALAMVIDSVVVLLIALIWALAVFSLAALVNDAVPWIMAIGAFGFFLLQWGYFSACEILMEGQTPGKRVLGIRTVSHLGGRPSVSAVLIRNLVRPIDYLAGVFVMAFDSQSRRIGDLVASTLVVHQVRTDPDHVVRMEHVPEHWTTEQILLVEAFLRRAARMDPEVVQDLSRRLLTWIERTAPELYEAVGALPALGGAVPVDGTMPRELERLCILLGVQTDLGVQTGPGETGA